MRQAFVFEGVAVIVGPWHEPGEPPERGTRVEVRLFDQEPWRGSFSAAQRVVLDQPVFRADLFDRMDQPVGNLESAHFHPNFEAVEPSDRFWPDGIKQDPTGWLARELSDLVHLLTRAGVDAAADSWLAADAVALREAVPAIITAVTATWDSVRDAAV